jgi:hypothetical protein
MKNATRDFINLLLSGTELPLWVCSLTNEKGAGNERHVRTRDVDTILDFCRRWDVPGRGTFYCVSTINGHRRNLENAGETAILWADIDFKDVREPQNKILAILRGLPAPPVMINASGHGLHPIWKLAIPYEGDVRSPLARLRLALGGDSKVCHPVALLRMPGTHNTKDGERKLVRSLPGGGQVMHQSELIETMINKLEPLIHLKNEAAEPDDPFRRHAKSVGFAPPIDAEARLRAMRHKGPGRRRRPPNAAAGHRQPPGGRPGRRRGSREGA